MICLAIKSFTKEKNLNILSLKSYYFSLSLYIIGLLIKVIKLVQKLLRQLSALKKILALNYVVYAKLPLPKCSL